MMCIKIGVNKLLKKIIFECYENDSTKGIEDFHKATIILGLQYENLLKIKEM
ncbi:hypothetical protein CSC2_47170 [Clostridium zeae]|uniref:Uncharacterized protein n=1 Tax=Clostridium zeae TaxID=2759022 RepID=A0ABQ1EHN3_9CLOT|nr:hypothetical protein CSC2_47170 [Clostridium zeae]